MIQHLQNTNTLIMCKPCEKKGDVNIPAKFWCEQTKSYFCESCKVGFHDLFHEDCEPENITERNKSATIRRKMSATGCGKHKEKLEYYCEDHQILGCHKCIIVDHRKCEVVISADDFRDKIQTTKIEDLLGELRKCVNSMEILLKDVEEQLHSMTEDQVTALESLTDLRTKVNERFDALQKELTDKLTALFKKEKEHLDISREKCERLMFAMQKTLTSSHDPCLKEDTVGTIGLFQRGQAEVESCKGLIQELEKSARSISLRHEYNPDILTLDTKTSLTLGEILIHQQQRNLPNTAALSEHHLKMTRKINVKVRTDDKDCKIFGIVLLSGGRIVVGDNANHKVKLFMENGDFKCEINLYDRPCDLCRIDDNTVAVMLTTVKTICVINVGDSTLTVKSNIKIENVTEDCLGVTYNNNTFIVGTPTSLFSVPNKGGEATMLHEVESRCLHLASDKINGRVFASIHTSKPDAVAVTRLSDGTHTDVLKVGFVNGTTGIDVDREGNVYVCGSRSHNVIQMSRDGTNVRELLTLSVGMEYPRAISVWGNKVVVTSDSPEQWKFVRVFQLV